MSLELTGTVRPKFDSCRMSDSLGPIASVVFFFKNHKEWSIPKEKLINQILFQKYRQYGCLNTTQRLSISRSSSERSGGEANTVVGGVKDAIEPLQESVTVDEVKPATAWRTNVLDDEINRTRRPTDSGIQGTRPDLPVRGQTIAYLNICFSIRLLGRLMGHTPWMLKFNVFRFAY